MNNTKQRHQEIYTAACSALEQAGGVAKIDDMPQPERVALLRSLYKQIADDASCHIGSAKTNLAKAMRRARYGIMQSRWGGKRDGAGRPKHQQMLDTASKKE